MNRAISLSLVACLLFPAFPAAAQVQSPLRAAVERGDFPALVDSDRREQSSGARPLELIWGELASIVRGQIVELPVMGATIRGEVMSVREDALLLDVRSTTSEQACPRGSALIQRASVSEIRLQKREGSWGRNLGTTLGVLTGVVVGLWVAGNVADSASVGIPLWLGIASGVTVGGYQIGRIADTRTIVIRVVR